MTIDLRICVPGQKLRMRNECLASYAATEKAMHSDTFPHVIQLHDGNFYSVTDYGRQFLERETPSDIIEILPMPTDSTIPQRGTKEFARYAAETMMAGAAGQTIQVSMKYQNDFIGGSALSWNWDMFDYRIKPKPTVIPWTIDSCPVGKVVTHTATGYRALIVAAGQSDAAIGQDGEQSYDDLLSLYNIDGSPCGTVQQ